MRVSMAWTTCISPLSATEVCRGLDGLTHWREQSSAVRRTIRFRDMYQQRFAGEVRALADSVR
jgi:hypothetical protein